MVVDKVEYIQAEIPPFLYTVTPVAPASAGRSAEMSGKQLAVMANARDRECVAGGGGRAESSPGR